VVLLKSNRFWIAILGAIILISITAMMLINKTSANVVRIFQESVQIERLDLSTVAEPYSITVESGSGINIISVEKGRIRISEANCPDGLCVRQGWISGGAMPIVCLPHKLIIQFDSDNTQRLDAIVG
jgi:hypothetical protein